LRVTESGNGTAARAENGWAIRVAQVTARLAEHRFTSHDGDGLVEAAVDGNGDPVAVVLTNRAVRLLSEAALGARVVAALDRARARADEVAGPLLAERLGAVLPGAPVDLVEDGELAAVETAHDPTGTVAATVNAHGELYDVRLARQVLELDRQVLAARIAAAETAAYHAALRTWANSPRYRRSRQNPG
jgi:DNA-binding protein YbaB